MKYKEKLDKTNEGYKLITFKVSISPNYAKARLLPRKAKKKEKKRLLALYARIVKKFILEEISK